MCKTCLTAAGGPVPFTEAMTDAAEKVTAVYSVDGWHTGGPLHVLVDDMNLEDHHFTAEGRQFVIDSHADWYADGPLDVALAAFDALAGLTQAERATVCFP